MDKEVSSPAEAVADIFDGARIAVGGFGVVGVPEYLIRALRDQGAKNLTCVSNNAGTDGRGLGLLLESKQISRMIASYVGENKEFARQYLSGELTVELTPQGTLAEKLRAAGAGIPAFYTITGAGTQVAEGGMPWRYDADGNVVESSPAKEERQFDTFGEEQTYVLEESLPCDFALVRAAKGDRHGNLVFNKSAQNFNPPAAQAGRITIAEVEELVEPGEIDPADVHVPGVYVHRVVKLSPEEAADKPIEKLTVQED
ncbi:putative succinyl-CoA:3-ketoacid coenzyme A transferase subunit A [Brevibacterium ravenspurgense]|uniref:Putative succinyl-CoA:3-ketoacid coenzyme A transferase subunit A n=1 Tax=Brevibacterium ravenspurgense TaxID=479117 RepID=A0A150HB98_9MICO|nr:CoA transferase subunit A [Brevibacterium ravenspurgense]KXZ59393.1 putative succinyl-CoA:3-ketoacid coenzyme A transferase subunit A [Brevibacterium ravenspurgense]